jgi:hypothetical protein
MINYYSNFNEVNQLFSDLDIIEKYEDIFSSRQWLMSFHDTYTPEKSLVLKLNSTQHSFSLEKNIWRFSGDPFNDFNSLSQSEVSILKKNNHLFGSGTRVHLSNIATPIESVESVEGFYSVDVQNFEKVVSKRILKQYREVLGSVHYVQLVPSDATFNVFLDDLLSSRTRNLSNHKLSQWNPSFDMKFEHLICRFCKMSNHTNKIRLDFLLDTTRNNVLASTLNFYFSNGIMCYLRSCNRSKSFSKFSFGMILDICILWKARELGYSVYDLTRGDEPYKTRLGASRYLRYNSTCIL